MEKMIEDLFNRGYAYDVFREAQIGGAMQYANGEASGRALAGENADKGIRDVTDGTKGRGQAEVDRTGIYVGVPMGLDKTAWENIAAVQQDYPNVARRAKAFQNAYKNAPEQEKNAMLDWTPENPDMSINLDGQVVDNNINKVMKTQTAPQQPKAKSSILQKLGFKESLFEEVLNASKLNESCSTSEARQKVNEEYGEIIQALENSWDEASKELREYENEVYSAWQQTYFRKKRNEYLDNLSRSIGVSDYDRADAFARSAVEKHSNTQQLLRLQTSAYNAQLRYESAMEKMMDEYARLLGGR